MYRQNNQAVPSSDLENPSQKKYIVNKHQNGIWISKPLCALLAIGVLLLAILVGLIVFFIVPRCNLTTPLALTKGGSHYNYNTNNDDEINNGFISTDNTDNRISFSKTSKVSERLPTNIKPTHYRLKIIPDIINLTTNGTILIQLHVQQSVDSIILLVEDIDILKVIVTPQDSDESLTIVQAEPLPGERFKIQLDKNLNSNSVYNLEIEFLGRLDNKWQGFYRSEYKINDEMNYLASTQFSPTDARIAFPCFDEPQFKANFAISVARPTNMTAISNMPLMKSEPFKNDWVWDHFEETPKMSTYLVAFVVSNLETIKSLNNNFSINIWSKPNSLNETKYASTIAPLILNFFEKYFKIKFPLPKIDIVAIPDFGFNAMENWGLITFRESALLFNPSHSDIDNKRDVATILSHELAHQWFGNLVTPKWWNDLWLKEGFANYFQYLAANFIEPDWKIKDEFIISETLNAFEIDALPSSRPLSFDPKNNQQIRQMFDELSYGKGACIIRMMRHFLGEDTFKNGLINFLEKYKYSNADKEALFNSLSEEAHKNSVLDKDISVKTIMNTWTEQAGFPVITAIADHANKKLILSQKRFLFVNNKKQSNTWWIPISVTLESQADFKTEPKIWLKDESMITVDLNISSWYLLNIDQTGYYIVNYDENNWRLLSDNIMNLPVSIRAQLISDSMDLARANLLDYDIPLKLIARMALKDTQIMFVPTMIAFKKLGFLSDILSNTPAFGLFEEYHSTIFKHTYELVDLHRDYFSENYLQQKIRKAVLRWSCRTSNSECSIKAQHMFRKWMQSDVPVPANLRENVYCTAIREGTEAEWNFAYRKYLNTKIATEKNILIDALGCTSKRWLLSRRLNALLQNESSIRIQDADRVFKSVAENSVANSLAFDFLRINWNKLIDYYGEGFSVISNMVSSLPRFMNTKYQLQELIRFKKDVENNIGAAEQAFDNAIEKVRSNVEWLEKNYQSIEQWFKSHKHHYNIFA